MRRPLYFSVLGLFLEHLGAKNQRKTSNCTSVLSVPIVPVILNCSPLFFKESPQKKFHDDDDEDDAEDDAEDEDDEDEMWM